MATFVKAVNEDALSFLYVELLALTLANEAISQ